MSNFITALQFLTRIQLVRQNETSAESFGRSVKLFPLIGAIIGLILAASDYIALRHLPLNLLATSLIAVEIALTGGLHCDGLMDTMDGIFSGRSRERMLEIMKDSRVGANGVMAFGLFLFLKWSLLVDLLTSCPWWILFIMPILGRFAMVIAITVFSYARKEGIGKAFAEFAGRRSLLVASGLTLILVVPFGIPAVISMAVAGLAAIAFCRYVSKVLGGLTGDVYGAVTEITELVVLATFLLELKSQSVLVLMEGTLMKVKVRAPGSCGELVQGTVNDQSFLITCPVNIWSEVTLQSEAQNIVAGAKTIEAVKRTWDYLGVVHHTGFGVSVETTLPAGKGMASSSADISAACQAAALMAGRKLTVDEIADIALSIEPTDGVFYPGIVMFDHLGGTIRKSLGFPPPITIAIFDTGGEVDTLQFNRRSDLRELNKAKESQVHQAATLVAQGIAAGDCGLIGRGATISAMANQSILFKACLPVIAELSSCFGAVGVNTAHSGTVVGILFPDNAATNIHQCIQAVQEKCPETVFLGVARLIAGGLRIVEGGC